MPARVARCAHLGLRLCGALGDDAVYGLVLRATHRRPLRLLAQNTQASRCARDPLSRSGASRDRDSGSQPRRHIRAAVRSDWRRAATHAGAPARSVAHLRPGRRFDADRVAALAGGVELVTTALLDFLTALALAPLLPGVIARVKALFAGRQGPPLLQAYFDLCKLLRKSGVYSTATTWIFRAGPIVACASVVAALALTPAAGRTALISFPADFVLLAYLLACGRFFTVLAALDTGSSFEGMGASREVHYAALGEPALLLGLLALARQTGTMSLPSLLGRASPLAPEAALVGAALFIVLLCENARIPFDDPNTHLELTMIHEAMVLDHGGVDLALIHYGSWLKLWLWSALLAGVLMPVALKTIVTPVPLVGVTGVLAVALGIGVVESCIARLRLLRVPHLLATALALAAVAFILGVR
ncbi:MAG: NADH-quinone oxidoreductase subunit H [Vicinamibacteria bacterium]|nr:NADH-quinone oxidoreductase subunit H [Vicinamibacteria bacterium]